MTYTQTLKQENMRFMKHTQSLFIDNTFKSKNENSHFCSFLENLKTPHYLLKVAYEFLMIVHGVLNRNL